VAALAALHLIIELGAALRTAALLELHHEFRAGSRIHLFLSFPASVYLKHTNLREIAPRAKAMESPRSASHVISNCPFTP
jgi:hypothetical protein